MIMTRMITIMMMIVMRMMVMIMMIMLMVTTTLKVMMSSTVATLFPLHTLFGRVEVNAKWSCPS